MYDINVTINKYIKNYNMFLPLSKKNLLREVEVDMHPNFQMKLGDDSIV